MERPWHFLQLPWNIEPNLRSVISAGPTAGTFSLFDDRHSGKIPSCCHLLYITLSASLLDTLNSLCGSSDTLFAPCFLHRFSIPWFSHCHHKLPFDIMQVAILTFGLTVLALGASGYPLPRISNEGNIAITSVFIANIPPS